MILETERLILSPRTLADTDDCFAMDREPEVTRYVSGPWADAIEHRAFIEARTVGPYPPDQGYWVVRAKSAPDVFLGWVLLIPVDAVGPEVEIGWRLRPRSWGSGFATEAARAVIGHAFTTAGLEAVIAEIQPENERSARVAEKLGMTLVSGWPSDADALRPHARGLDGARALANAPLQSQPASTGSFSPDAPSPVPPATSKSKASLPSFSVTITWPPRISRPNRISSASGFLMFSWITRASGRAP
jgi:RimJ/RimL family protein N-acetyltransferase